MIPCFGSIFILTLILVANRASSSVVVDGEQDDVESIVKSLCKDSAWHSNRISRLSTINKLNTYFSSVSSDSDLALCRDEYLEPLEELKSVLETSSDNVCSISKLEQINKFHWTYIVGGLSRKWHKASDASLPEPLRLFFLHYANEVAQKCMETLPDRLKAAVGDKQIQAESLFSTKLGSSIDGLSLALVPKAGVKNYDNFILIWNQVIDRERRKGRIVGKKIDDLSKEPVVGLMKARDPTNVWSMQSQCRQELRPIYVDSVLPVMRLLENGYGLVDERTGEQVKKDQLISNWYSITQLCELLIPVNFYKDESMKLGGASMLSSWEETEGLGRPENVIPVDELAPSNINIKPVQLDDDHVLMSAADNKIINQVKSNLKARSKVFRAFVKNMLMNLKGKFSGKLKNLFMSRKTKDNEYVKEDGNKILSVAEAEVNELLEEDGTGGIESKKVALTRRKRGLFKKRTEPLTEAEITHRVHIIFNVGIISIVLILMGITIFLCIHFSGAGK